MYVSLGERTEKTVRLYFEKTKRNEAIQNVLPQKAKTAEEAVRDYEATLLPNATSYGRTIIADGAYIGDVWCYCIDTEDTPNAMLSYCVFEQEYWGKGAATEAVRLFLREVAKKYGVKTVGAYTFSSNISSVKVLERNQFELIEEFAEDGVSSKYFQRAVQNDETAESLEK